MDGGEYKTAIIKMVKEIKQISFLKMIYTVVKTCNEKEKSSE